MKIPDLASKVETILTGPDSTVIRNYLGGIVGGRTLDCTNFTEKVIKAGHVVIRDKAEGTYLPMPVSDGAYASLPENCEYAGVVVCSATVDEPFVGIMYAGEVNDLCVPFPVDSIKAAMKTALPQLVFIHD